MSTIGNPSGIKHKPSPKRKYYTLKEANDSLVYVSKIAYDLMKAYRDLVRIRKTIEALVCLKELEGLELAHDKTREYIDTLIDELHVTGAELKDFEKGIVDFPSILKDREIYLRWEYGENCIKTWREVDIFFDHFHSIIEIREIV